MDNREYLRRVFCAKRSIIALVILICVCILSFVAASLIQSKPWSAAAQAVCAVIMFSQLLIIGRHAARTANDLEKETQSKKKKKQK